MVKTGIIRTAAFDTLVNMPDVFTGQWETIERHGIAYQKIHAFRQYFTEEVVAQLETIFDTEQEYQDWLANDIHYLSRSWAQDYKDYKRARKVMQGMVAATGFSNLSESGKKIAAEWRCCNEAEMASVLTLQERVDTGVIFDKNSQESRSIRYNYCKSLLYELLEKADGDNVVGMIISKGFKDLYIEYGQEGTMKTNYKGEVDNAGLFDFVLGTEAGRAAFGVVMANLITVPKSGKTVQEVVDSCMDILDNGNY